MNKTCVPLVHRSVTSRPFRKLWQTDRPADRLTDQRTEPWGHRDNTSSNHISYIYQNKSYYKPIFRKQIITKNLKQETKSESKKKKYSRGISKHCCSQAIWLLIFLAIFSKLSWKSNRILLYMFIYFAGEVVFDLENVKLWSRSGPYFRVNKTLI